MLKITSDVPNDNNQTERSHCSEIKKSFKENEQSHTENVAPNDPNDPNDISVVRKMETLVMQVQKLGVEQGTEKDPTEMGEKITNWFTSPTKRLLTDSILNIQASLHGLYKQVGRRRKESQ